MINFERFVARRGIDLRVFFTVNGINSDKELAEYCSQNGMTTPEESYFKEEVKDIPEVNYLIFKIKCVFIFCF